MTEILLLIFSVLGFFTWHIWWMKTTLNSSRGLFARMSIGFLGIASAVVTALVAAPIVTNSMPGMEGLVHLVYLVFPLMIIYSVAGLFGLYFMARNHFRRSAMASIKGDDDSGSDPRS